MLLPAYALAQQDAQKDQPPPSAVVKIEPIRGNRVNGTLTLDQTGQGVSVKGTLNGLTPGKHGLHVTQADPVRTAAAIITQGMRPTEHPILRTTSITSAIWATL